MEWEVRIIEWLQNNAGTVSLFLGRLMAFVGSEKGLLLVILAVMFGLDKKTGRKAAIIITSMISWLSMIKTIVMRPRPYLQHPDRVKMLAKVETEAASDNVAAQGYSFPSMHSASVVALYFTLARSLKKKWVWTMAVVLTVLVAFSRVLVGAHYPTDVLTGLALGLVSMVIYDFVERRSNKEWLTAAIMLASALPGLFFVRTQDYFTSLGLLIALAAAIPFEDKFVRYESTDRILIKILRLAGGLAVYFVLNSILKLPFNKDFLECGSFLSLLVRTFRYAIVMFMVLGIYPMIFPWYEKIGKNK